MRTNFSDSYDRRTVGNMKSLFPQKALYSSIPILPDGSLSRYSRPRRSPLAR
jgi:hypothetical protein